jgi:hypothetical protein
MKHFQTEPEMIPGARSSPCLLPEDTEDGVELMHQLDQWMDSVRRMSLLLTAKDLGLFDAFLETRSAADVAGDLHLDPVMLRLACDGLVAMGLMRCHEGEYRTSELGIRYLTSVSLLDQDSSLDQYRRGVVNWARLPKMLREGPDHIEREGFFTERWLKGMAERSLCEYRPIAERIARSVALDGKTRMLDLGGGHGMHALTFQSLHPGLEVYIFDQPQMVGVAQGYIQRFQAKNAHVIAGDYYQDGIGSGYDLLLSSFNSSGSDPLLIPKLRDAIVPRGHLVVRTFSESSKEDALVNLEWNFTVFDGRDKGRRRWDFPGALNLDQYGDRLKENGFVLVDRFVADDISEVLVAMKVDPR